MRLTDKCQYSLKFQVLTGVSGVHAPSCLAITRGHQQDHILRSSWAAAPGRLSTEL